MLNEEIINRLLRFYYNNKEILLTKYENLIKLEKDFDVLISPIRVIVSTFYLLETNGEGNELPQEYIDMYEYIDTNDEWLDGAYERFLEREPDLRNDDKVDKIMFSISTFFNSYKELQKQKEVMKPNSLIYQKITKIHNFVTDDGTHIDQADIEINKQTIGCITGFSERYPNLKVGDTIVLEVYYPEPHDYEVPFARTREVEIIKNQNN